jgi:hypothetical protein
MTVPTDRVGPLRRSVLASIRRQIGEPLVGGDTGHRIHRSSAVLGRSACSADHSFGDFVERWRWVVAARFALREPNRAADVWSFCLWPAAENHVAGEQAFVLPTFAVGLNRVLRCRAGGFFHARRLRKGRLGWLRLQRLPRLHRTKTFLIVTQPVRVRSNGRRLRLSWTPRRLGLTSDQDDHQNSERQARHQPRLESARQHTARDRPVVADWRSG